MSDTNRFSPVGRSNSPLNMDSWNGTVDLSVNDIEDINMVAFASCTDGSGVDATIRANHRTDADANVTNSNGTDNCGTSPGGTLAEKFCKKKDSAPSVSRRKKKPKGMPKRPLSAYNIFFQSERLIVLNEHGISVAEGLESQSTNASGSHRVSFEDLGKIIGKRWKALGDDLRKQFESKAEEDSLRYRDEMEVFNERKRKRHEEQNREFEESNRDFLDPRSDGAGRDSQDVRDPPRKINATGPGGVSFYATFPTDSSTKKQPPHYPTERAYSPIPPGTIVVMPDLTGHERRFQVNYRFYTMTRKAAETYMGSLASKMPYRFSEPPAEYQAREEPPPAHFSFPTWG